MPTVRLLHGLGADRRAFQRFERLLPVAWEPVSLDLLGHGAAPHPSTGYSLEEHAAYIAGVIEAIAPCVLVGHSYGAATAVAIAARHASSVRGIVLLDPITHMGDAAVGSRTEQMMHARRVGTLRETVDRLFPEASEPLKAWTVETWEQMSVGVIDEFDPHWTRFADRVEVPVAIVHGQLELGGGGDLAADWFDEPRVTSIDGAGHYLHATHARETADAVRDSVNWIIDA
ncbi:MAG: alpha/beta hydrolase [Thermoleophilia bacterium]|nr:alpha/beta hydrolase [Thermoleophilia bacterium]